MCKQGGNLKSLELLALTGLWLVLLNSCTSLSLVPASQGSVGSCHSFVVASMYEEKLNQNGIAHGLSEKDIFLRVYLQGISEENEILRQLTLSTDRRLPQNYREGARLKQVAGLVKKHGVLSRKEAPYTNGLKTSFPMQMEKLREAREIVYREAASMRSRLGRPLTRAEKQQIVDPHYATLQSQGVIRAFKIKNGNRNDVKKVANRFVYKEVNAGRSVAKLPHIIKLLEQGSVGAGVSRYPWTKGGNPGGGGGHAVVLRSYDAAKREFVVTNSWWSSSFGSKHYDRVDAQEFMSCLDTYAWLQDIGPPSARKTAANSVAKTVVNTTKMKDQRVAGKPKARNGSLVKGS